MEYQKSEEGLPISNFIGNEIKEGNIVKGTVKNIRKFGAFVEIEQGPVGLLHIEDISVSRIKSPFERFFSGQKIDVVIKSIDNETGRIILSYKELFRYMGRKCGKHNRKSIYMAKENIKHIKYGRFCFN